MHHRPRRPPSRAPRVVVVVVVDRFRRALEPGRESRHVARRSRRRRARTAAQAPSRRSRQRRRAAPARDGARAHVHDRLEHDEEPRSSAPPPRPNLMKNTHGGALAQAQVVEVATGNAPSTTAAFANMGLTEASMRAIHEVMGFTHATAVQDSTLPHIMRGLDVLARAKTGSGKTVGFLFPAIERLAKTRSAAKGGRVVPGRFRRRESWRRKSARRRRVC